MSSNLPAQTFADSVALVGDHITHQDIKHGGLFSFTNREIYAHLLAASELNPALVLPVFTTPPATGSSLDYFISYRRASRARILLSERYPPLNWNHHRYHLRREHEHHLDKLQEQLTKAKPKVTVALGAFAMWALTGSSHMGTYHGKFLFNELTGYGYVIPTFSLAAIRYDKNREWYVRTVLDTAKKSSMIKLPRALFSG